MWRPNLTKPLGRRQFLALGGALAALKVLLDFAIAKAFGQPFSLSFYVVPNASPLFSPPAGPDHPSSEATAYWLAVVGCALPFLLAGLALTVRRLRDAGASGLLSILFVVPFVKFLFFLCLALVPTRAREPRTFDDERGPFRSAHIDLGPGEERPDRPLLAGLAGVLAGDGVSLLAMGVSVGLLRDYGWPLMIATPMLAGFVATSVYARFCKPTGIGATMVTLATFMLGMLLLVVAGLEGVGCIAMLAPLFFGEALLGTLLAYNLARTSPLPARILGSSLVMLPAAFATNGASPLPPEAALPVESSVVVNAPPDVVWRRVVAFPPLPEPTEPLFRAGIAAPLSATIDGSGVGAIRRCKFTTGDFVEPIDVWEPGRELGFHVASEPDPMHEWTLRAGPRPPHLDGYLESVRGQFVLEPLPNGATRLIGRTWYRVHMEPAAYWRLWGDRIIHSIHLRVLEHVARLAEQDAQTQAPRTSRPDP